MFPSHDHEKLDDRTGAVKTEDLATECGMSKEDTKRLIDALICTGEVEYTGVRGRHGGLVHNSLQDSRNADKAEKEAKAAVNKAKRAVKALRELGQPVPPELLVQAGETPAVEEETAQTGTEG